MQYQIRGQKIGCKVQYHVWLSNMDKYKLEEKKLTTRKVTQ